MATRLEQAKQKLERLKTEFNQASNVAFEHMEKTNGQPMNDKKGGNTFLKKQQQLEERIFKKLHEIEEQEERIEKLERQEFKKENHLTSSGGLQTSVHNIEKLKERKQTKKTREKVKMLETVAKKAEKDSQTMSEKTKQLIESEKVTQWQKLPIFYFVKGLRKVALLIDDKGEFYVSKKYPTKTKEDENFVEALLQ